MPAAHTVCTYAPPTPSEMLAFDLNADNMLEGLPPLYPRGHTYVIPNKNVKFGLVRPYNPYSL